MKRNSITKVKNIYYTRDYCIHKVNLICFNNYQSITVKDVDTDEVFYTKKEYLFTDINDATQYLRVKAWQDKVFNIDNLKGLIK